MRLIKCKKIVIFLILALFIALLFNNNAVFAAINEEYSNVDSVSDNYLDDAMSDSSLLELLAKLIYAVGRFLEWILGTIFKLLTGSTDFPWADKIVFNAVPLLDVNFINPGGYVEGKSIANQTFVGQTAIQGVLKNIYATVLTLAAAFFGIVVLITAIKLVITTIASEKAKYKQAIVDWLIGFVMLFCIHYAIAFIFYLNEQLVIVASKIVTESLKNKEVAAVQTQTELTSELIDNVRKSGVTYRGELVADILERNELIVMTWLSAVDSDDTSKGVHEALMRDVKWWSFGADVAGTHKEQYINLGRVIWWAEQANISVEELQKIKVKAFQMELLDQNSEALVEQACSNDCFAGRGDWTGMQKQNEAIKKYIEERLLYEYIYNGDIYLGVEDLDGYQDLLFDPNAYDNSVDDNDGDDVDDEHYVYAPKHKYEFYTYRYVLWDIDNILALSPDFSRSDVAQALQNAKKIIKDGIDGENGLDKEEKSYLKSLRDEIFEEQNNMGTILGLVCIDLCTKPGKVTTTHTGIYRYDQAISTAEAKKIFGEQYSEFLQVLNTDKKLEAVYYGTVQDNSIAHPYITPKYSGTEPVTVGVTSSTVSQDTFLLTAGIKKIYKSGHDAWTSDSVFYWSDLLKELVALKSASNTSSGKPVEGSGKATRILSDLATYFRYNAYSKELKTHAVTGVKNGDNIYIQNMIMYAILVAQSLILFIAYVKRLFYVIMLALMAPIVVVIDFFQKFGK